MGGKQKQAQRTKGNTRPSSSGRSAERLMASGASTNLNDLSGFTSLMLQSEHLGAMKSNHPIQLDSSIDGDIRMVMKKMTKKDAITRLKALQEFQTLCAKTDEDTLLGALPFWPRLFNKLCLDPDRRVREATHFAHLQLVSRVKRNLAPHLKMIMGNWLQGQYDSYPPAASAAKSAFQKAFTEEKRADALLYCKDEIFHAITDNLFHQTPQSLCDPEVADKEEIGETYNRVLSSSLSVLGFFLDVVAQMEHEKLMESYKQIVTNGKFWKLAKNEAQQVRCAWFKLIAIMCRILPSVLESHLAKLCPAVLGWLDESDPVVASEIWDAALHILVAFKEWSKHFNLQKAILPKIFSTLSKGGNGNASVICPYMLPFLSLLPMELVENPDKVYYKYFCSLREGLLVELTHNRSSDARALIATFFECLTFVLGKHSRDSDLPPNFAEILILEQVIPIVKGLLTEESFRLLSPTLYSHLSDLVRFIHSHCVPSETHSIFFKNIAKIFWEALTTLCSSILLNHEDLQLHFVTNLYLMFSSFVSDEKSPVLKRKHVKVKFLDSPLPDQPTTSAKNNYECDILKGILHQPLFDDVANPLAQCAFDLCAVSCTAYISQKSFLHLKFLSEMSSTFACDKLFEVLLKSCELLDCSNEGELVGTALKFFEHFIVKWILSQGCNATEDVTSTAKLIFSVYRCVENVDQKLSVLNEICHLKSLCILEEVVRALLPLFSNDDVVKRWFQGATFNNIIVELLEMLISVAKSTSYQNGEKDQVSKTWNLLTVCLTTVDGLDMVLPDAYVNKLLKRMRNLLVYNSENKALGHICMKDTLGHFGKFCHQFFENVPYCWRVSESYSVLMSLFQLSCEPVPDELQKLHDDIRYSLMTGVQSLISSQELEKSQQFLNTAAIYIHELIFHHQHPVETLDTASCTVVSLTQIMKKYLFSESGVNEDFMMKFSLVEGMLSLMLPTEEEWDELSEKFSQNIVLEDLMNGKLFFSNPPAISDLPCNSCEISLTFSIMMLDMFDELFSEDVLLQISNFERFKIHFMGILNAATYCKVAKERLKNAGVLYFEKDLKYWSELLDSRMKSIFQLMRCKEFDLQFLDDCLCKAHQQGRIWSYTLFEVVAFLMSENLITSLKKLLDVSLALKSDFGLHVIQILTPVVDFNVNLEILSAFFEENKNDSMLPNVESARYMCIISTFLESLPEHVLKQSDVNNIVVRMMDMLLQWKNSDNLKPGLPGDWNALCVNVEIVKTMTVIVTKYYHMLSSQHWDLILCHLGSSLHCLSESSKSPLVLQTQIFGSMIFHLTDSVGETMNYFSSSVESINNLPPDLITEWNEFFTKQVFSSLLQIFVMTTYHYDFTPRVSLKDCYFFESITTPLKWVPTNVILSNDLPLMLNPQWDESDIATPANVKTALNYLCPLLVSFVHDVQVGAYTILSNVMSSLTQYEGGHSNENDAQTFPGALLDVLQEANNFIHRLLGDEKFGELFIVDPVTDANSYRFVSGYLYSWNLILKMFVSTTSEIRSRYAIYLRESGLSDNLVRFLFNLIPSNPTLSIGCVNSEKKSSKMPSEHLRPIFSEPPTLHVSCGRSVILIQHMACCIYYEALRCIPALVREWWNGLDRRAAQIVEKFTTKFASPLLCSENILGVQNAEKKFDNMTVKTRLTSKEVVAIYAVDEVSFELVVKLPDNHPLGPVTIETGRRVGVSSSQWSYWLLQLTTFLMQQNGSILDGLVLWKRNIDKKFEGVEECYVCFYVVHSSTCQLPRLICRTCKKKFHSSCLYKWFNTSGHSTCPLCRSIF